MTTGLYCGFGRIRHADADNSPRDAAFLRPLIEDISRGLRILETGGLLLPWDLAQRTSRPSSLPRTRSQRPASGMPDSPREGARSRPGWGADHRAAMPRETNTCRTCAAGGEAAAPTDSEARPPQEAREAQAPDRTPRRAAFPRRRRGPGASGAHARTRHVPISVCTSLGAGKPSGARRRPIKS